VTPRAFSFLLIFIAITASAQERAAIAPIVSFDYGKPLFINRTPGVLNSFNITPSGSSSAYSYGLGAELTFPDAIADHIGLMGGLMGIYTSGNFIFDDPKYTVSGIDRKLQFEVAMTGNVSSFAIHAGPWLSQSLSRNVFENDPNGIGIASGDSIASSKTHIGLSAGFTWLIPDFPFRPELHASLDLTERSNAGTSAWSFGLSIGYPIPLRSDEPSASSTPVPVPSEPIAIKRPASPRVRFLINGSEARGNPPLERVETHVKQYAMVDSANIPPRVTQWVEESYHLPHLALLCVFDRKSAGYLMILKDSLRLMEYSFGGTPNATPDSDTILDLEKDVAWNNVLNHLNTGESNRLIAELRTNREQLSLSSDTLLLPAVDTTLVTRTISKKRFCFVLSDNFHNVSGGKESLDLLLGKIGSLLDPNMRVSISESTGSSNAQAHTELLGRVQNALGTYYSTPRPDESAHGGVTTVILEN